MGRRVWSEKEHQDDCRVDWNANPEDEDEGASPYGSPVENQREERRLAKAHERKMRQYATNGVYAYEDENG